MRTFYRHSYRLLATCLLACMLLTGCGPSEEKIAAAQSKYTQLIDIHNQVVAAHKEISHDTLDSDLTALSEELGQMDHYNLLEMKDEEIDTLIASMDTMIASYEASLASIAQIKAEEEASVIVTIPVTLTNESGFGFSKLMLYEKGSTSKDNLLKEETAFAHTQHMTGLFIYRDVDSTPWILEAEDTEGNNYQFELPVDTYTEEGISLSFSYDTETEALNCT